VPAAFTVGQIVRPKLQYLRIDGNMQDWQGKRCAQGWISSVDAVAILASALYWSPNTSTFGSGFTTEQLYHVKIWNMDTRAFETVQYPESELVAGTVASNPITGVFTDPEDPSAVVDVIQVDGSPATNNPSANLVRSRV
jgi:hypothetical protein